jgi:uncharacterized protein YqgC (DUF456 family)
MSPKAIRHKSSLWLKIVGWTGIVVGLTGLILPIIPGIPILIAGLVTLSTQHRWARALLLWAKRRFRSLRTAAKDLGKRRVVGETD